MVRRGLVGIAAAVVVGAGAGGFLLGANSDAVRPIRSVGATEVAEAMRADDFFSTYRHETLLIRGTVVTDETVNDHRELVLLTASTYRTICSVGLSVQRLALNSSVTLVAIADSAHRRRDAVAFNNCAAFDDQPPTP